MDGGVFDGKIVGRIDLERSCSDQELSVVVVFEWHVLV